VNKWFGTTKAFDHFVRHNLKLLGDNSERRKLFNEGSRPCGMPYKTMVSVSAPLLWRHLGLIMWLLWHKEPALAFVVVSETLLLCLVLSPIFLEGIWRLAVRFREKRPTELEDFGVSILTACLAIAFSAGQQYFLRQCRESLIILLNLTGACEHLGVRDAC